MRQSLAGRKLEKSRARYEHEHAALGSFVTIEEPNVVVIEAGYGACRACDCRGYKKGNQPSFCGTCSHHFSQHR